jgi:hypothetical protein
LPRKTPAQYFILIDPPYWPNKNIFLRLIKKKTQDSRFILQNFGWVYLIQKTVWEFIYLISRVNDISLVLKQKDQLLFLDNFKDKWILIIRNEEDEYCSPDIKVALAAYGHVNYKVLPGYHDDLNINPQPYIDLLPKQI